MEPTSCEGCGGAVTSTTRFCPRCGRAVTRDGVTPTPLAGTRPARRLGPNVVQCGTCGTQSVPDFAYCFECGAPMGAVVDASRAVRMQDTEEAPRRRLSTGAKIAIGVGIFVLLGFGACGGCIWLVGHRMHEEMAERTKILALIGPRMPPDEVVFCDRATAFADSVVPENGIQMNPAEIQKLIEKRKAGFQPGPVKGWLGILTTVGSTHGMNVTLELPCEGRPIRLQTHERSKTGNAPGYPIDSDTPLYDEARRLHAKGVRFDAELIHPLDPDPSEGSFGALILMNPQYVVRLTALAPFEAKDAS